MLRVINIRGTNGSGKTTLVRSLMTDEPDEVPVEIGNERTPGHWLPKKRIVIVGPYPSTKATGGMDNVRTTAEALEAVMAAAEGRFLIRGSFFDYRVQGSIRAVVFEGILISTVYQTWLDFSRKLKGWHSEGLVWAFMDTPKEVCVERVKERRAAKGRPTEGFKEELVTEKWEAIQRVRRKAEQDRELVLSLGQQPLKSLNYFLSYSGG